MSDAVYNPLNRPVESLPVIYGFNNGGPEGYKHACLIAENGVFLGDHCCSCEGFMPGDLGIIEGTREDRHLRFREHYPDGYRMEFVPQAAVKSHARLQAAFAVYKKDLRRFIEAGEVTNDMI